MLDVRRQAHPRMPAHFINRIRRRWKSGIGERTHRYGHVLRLALGVVMHGSTTLRTEVEMSPAALIAGKDMHRRRAGDLHSFSPKARLHRKHTAGPALARQAMADRHAQRLLARSEAELTAAAGGGAMGHLWSAEIFRFSNVHAQVRQRSPLPLQRGFDQSAHLKCRTAHILFRSAQSPEICILACSSLGREAIARLRALEPLSIVNRRRSLAEPNQGRSEDHELLCSSHMTSHRRRRQFAMLQLEPRLLC